MKLFQGKVNELAQDTLVNLGLDYSLQLKFRRRFNRLKFPKKKQLELVDDLKSWLEDGGNIRHACESILHSAESLNQSTAPYAKATRDILDAVINGRSIADGMEDWFNQEIIMVFTVGQEANALSEMLVDYTDQVEEIEQARKDFIKPLIYPSILFSIGIAMAFLMANVMMENFIEIIPKSAWPPESRFFHTVYSTLYAHIVLIAAVTIVFVYWLFWWTVNGRGPVRRLLQGRFPFSIYSYFKAMQIAKMMALLVGRVYSPRETATKLQATASPFLRWHLRLIAKREAQGSESVAYSFNTGLFPPRLIQRMEAITSRGDASSKIRALESAGRRSADEAIRAMAASKNFAVTILYMVSAANIIFSFVAFAGVYLGMMNAI